MDEVFILCSGHSLNKLSDNEKVYISNRASIGVNRYIDAWPQIGILPTMHACITNDPAIIDFNVSNLAGAGIQLIIKESQEEIVTSVSRLVDYVGLKTIDSWSVDAGSMYGHVTALPSVINIATTVFPDHHIRIVGTEGLDGNYFQPLNQNAEMDPMKDHVSKTYITDDDWELILKGVSEAGCQISTTERASFLCEHMAHVGIDWRGDDVKGYQGGLLGLAKNLGKAVVNQVKDTVKSGSVYVTEAERKRRWDVCSTCPFLVAGKCSLCGCKMKEKVKWRTSECEDKPKRW